MNIIQDQQGKTTFVRIDGDVDMSTSTKVRDILIRILKQKVLSLVVDLDKVSYIDSSGLATLVECYQDIKKYGGKMRLVITNSHIMDVFRLARMDKIFEIYKTEKDALSGI